MTLQFRQRSRYIPKHVRRQLAKEARGRCCLCRTLVIPEKAYFENISAVLEGHHIIHFSGGGSNTEENLILVCPTCHAVAHARPDIYTVKYLRAEKKHWVGMAHVVPQDLLCESTSVESGGKQGISQTMQAPFALDSLGLAFTITPPFQITVHEFIEFLLARILSPIDEYDHGKLLSHRYNFCLTHRHNKEEIFSPSERLYDIPLKGDDVYTLKSDIRERDLLAIQTSGVAISIKPFEPAENQIYCITVINLDSENETDAYVEVRGSDGFYAFYGTTASRRGGHPIYVPGAQRGVIDRVTAAVLTLDRTWTSVIFGAEDKPASLSRGNLRWLTKRRKYPTFILSLLYKYQNDFKPYRM